MQTYLIRRLLLMIPTLFVITVVVFLMVHLIPGDIVDLMVIQQQQHMTEQTSGSGKLLVFDREALQERLGLDVPLHIQYIRWMKGIFTRGDFGQSLWTDYSVAYLIGFRLPVSLELGFMAFIIAQLIAFPVGIISAVRQDTWMDYLGRSFAILSLATPAFWLGTLLMVWPAIWWGWSPPTYYIPFNENPGQHLLQFLIPAFLVGTAMSAVTMRVLRTTILDVLRQDYVRTAWSKGLRERVVILRHVARNALIPVVTIMAGQLGVMIGGMVIMEEIFSLPGMGRLFLNAITRRDYPVVSGLNLIFAVFGVFMILVVDMSYAFLDPRIRYR